MDDTYPENQIRGREEGYVPERQQALRRRVTSRPLKQREEGKQRIVWWMAACLIIMAGSIDLFEALLTFVGIGLALNPVISVAADTLFIIWFWMLGINITSNPRAFFAMAGQAVIGLIPALNALPELTLGVLGVVILTRITDKSGIMGKAMGALPGKMKI